MSALAEKRLNVDEILLWADAREGKWELHDGVPVDKSSERVRNTATRFDAVFALRAAIDCARAPCSAYSGGIAVRVREDRAFVPNALICLIPATNDREISNPLVVVDGLSAIAEEYVIKLEGYYFSLAAWRTRGRGGRFFLREGW
jgi:hypothetical protein